MRKRTFAIAIALAGVGVGAAILSGALRRRPAWWQPPAPEAPRIVELAERLEGGLSDQLTRVRDPEGADWAVRITEEQLNAWLVARLPKWREHAGHGDAPQLVQVHMADGRLTIGLEASGSRVVAVTVEPSVAGDQLTVRILGGSVGRLGVTAPLAAGNIAEVIAALGGMDDSLDGDVRRLVDAVLRGEPVDASFSLGDGRRVRLLDVEVGDGAIAVRAETG